MSRYTTQSISALRQQERERQQQCRLLLQWTIKKYDNGWHHSCQGLMLHRQSHSLTSKTVRLTTASKVTVGSRSQLQYHTFSNSSSITRYNSIVAAKHIPTVQSSITHQSRNLHRIKYVYSPVYLSIHSTNLRVAISHNSGTRVVSHHITSDCTAQIAAASFEQPADFRWDRPLA